jgi:hypothetical protein
MSGPGGFTHLCRRDLGPHDEGGQGLDGAGERQQWGDAYHFSYSMNGHWLPCQGNGSGAVLMDSLGRPSAGRWPAGRWP